jgi:prevent-host-death family protein
MDEVALVDAKIRFSELISRVEAGEEIVITRRGKVVARLLPAAAKQASERHARKAIASLRSSRKGVSLGSLKVRDLIGEGRC